jgi:LmbE family N-acetylglucosaminyl deacetylase
MVVCAHPDDAEIGAGGLIVLNESVVVSVTNGANDSRSWNEARAEMEKSVEIMGFISIIWDYPIDVHCNAQLVSQLDKVVEDHQIDTIVTHFIHDTNQAHREVAEAAIAAGRKVRTVLMMEPSPPAGRSWQAFQPQLFVDITSIHETKFKALEMYVSQIKKYGDHWIEALKAREIMRGWEIGVERAEVFQIVRIML